MDNLFNSIYNFPVIGFFTILLIIFNSLTFFLYLIDKQRSMKNKKRISEKTLMIFTVLGGGFGALIGMLLCRHKTKKLKFKLVVLLGLIITVTTVIHIVYGVTLGKVVRYIEIDFYSEKWPKKLNGYRIAFITDKHYISDEEMKNVVTKLNEKTIDLLLLGGDFADYRRTAPHYRGTVRELSKTKTTDGIFGVDGNHDNYRSLFKAKQRYGITPLDNSGIHIREGFFLAGIQDKRYRSPDIKKAISRAYEEDFVLLLTHNPDTTMKQSTKGIDLIFAGHTHGGQIAIFGFPICLVFCGITDYRLRFSGGFAYSADNVPVYTSVGIGVYYSWPRIFSRPEVVIFTMYNK